MRHSITVLTIAVIGFAAMSSFTPAPAEAGSVLDELRSRGMGKWVDRYVDEDDDGKVRYKSSKGKKTADNNGSSSSNTDSTSNISRRWSSYGNR